MSAHKRANANLITLRLKEKGARYWITAIIILFLSVTASPYVYDYLHLTNARSSLFQHLLDWGPRPLQPIFLRIVLVEDDEYWLGDLLAGRRPIKRDYVAQLVDKLVDANVHVIGLDFDLRLPNPDSTFIPKDYQEETLVLIRSIVNAAKRGKKIVLATPIWLAEQQRYRRDFDPYQAYGLCTQDAEGKLSFRQPVSTELQQQIEAYRNNISCGYISLPDDPLVVPSQIPMLDNSFLDSFSLAVARAGWPTLVENIGSRVFYGSYISEEKLRNSNVILSAKLVRQSSNEQALAEIRSLVEAKAVIVGGNWSSYAAGREPRIDQHWTPIGPVAGAVLQANFVEALLDRRTYGYTSEFLLRGSEIAYGAIAALAFALVRSIWGKLASILTLCIVLLFLQWSALHGFGVFFDVYVPLLGLGLHSLYERLFNPDGLIHSRRRTQSNRTQPRT